MQLKNITQKYYFYYCLQQILYLRNILRNKKIVTQVDIPVH